MSWWSGRYAAVVLWPVPSNEMGVLRAEALRAEGWFAEALAAEEANRDGRVLDGYLILALPSAPSDQVQAEVWHLELSSQVCRKHVVWPSGDARQSWLRLDSVTVLALPEGVTAVSGEPRWPTMEPEAEALWRDIERLGPAAAAEAHSSAT